MNEEIKQILENQWAIMKSLFNQDSESDEELIKSIDKTNELLNPEAKPTLAEKTFDALSEGEDK